VTAATELGITLPRFTGHAMGTARTEPDADGRFVTFKRRLVSEAVAANDGIEWTLWQERVDRPVLIAAFREPLIPQPEEVANALLLLRGWLLDGWSEEATKQAVARHPRGKTVAVTT